MRFLDPGWFLLGALALPILLLYMLRLRRRSVQVSSIMLWQALLRERQANTPWQRLRKNLLLFLQLLILAALVFALARPALEVPVIASGSVVVLLDASASMAATDVKPNRFEAARAAAGDLIHALASDAKMTLILVARQPRAIAAGESNHQNLHQSLAEARVTQQEANWQAAFALASGAISAGGDPKTTVVILSDGGIPSTGLPPIAAEIRYLPIGVSGNNLAISALALRPAGVYNELFIGVTNFSAEDRQAVLSVYLDDALITAQTLNIPAQGKASLSLKDFPAVRPPQKGIVRAQLNPLLEESENPSWDFLDLDNTAFAISRSLSSRRVLLVSQGNFFLEQLLAATPNLQAFRALPAETTPAERSNFSLPAEPFDVFILDEELPIHAETGEPVLPSGNLLLINPPANPLFSVNGVISPITEMRVNEHPLTQYLDWGEVHIRQASLIQKPPWAEVLVDSSAGPLILAGETGGRRVAVLTFDLNDSDLPLQIAFPILFANLLDFLAPPEGVIPDKPLTPGEGVAVLVPLTVDEVLVASPNGEVHAAEPTESGFYFPYAEELGVYTVNYATGGELRSEFFPVNLFSPAESAIQPADSIQAGKTTIPAQERKELGIQEGWFWAVRIGLLFLAVEWWVYHRHLTAPRASWLAGLKQAQKTRL